MPVYLLHGFRWPRGLIRIHIILQNLDDAAAEWLVAPATTSTLLSNFQEIYTESMMHLSDLRFVEQYDPSDTSSGAGSQPYAYVADVCEVIKLGMDVDEVRGRGVPSDQWSAMIDLRDKLAPEEKIGWYVVVCGDENRWAPGLSPSSSSTPQEDSTGASQNEDDSDASYAHSSTGNEDAVPDVTPASPEEQPKGLKRFFSTISKRKSRTNLESSQSVESMNATLRDQAVNEPKKYATSVAGSSGSSSQKMAIPSPDESRQKALMQETRKPAQRASMPKLQTAELQPQASKRALAGLGSVVTSPGGLSLIPDDDEDHEVITGPSQDDEDDLAAPAPVVKHGKQQDLVTRHHKRSSVASFKSGARGTSPETLRRLSPLVRTHPDSFSNSANYSPVEPHQPHRLQHELLPDDIDEEPRRSVKHISPPASYVPTGAPPSGVSSIRTSRSTSPVKIQGRQRSNSRLSALNALEGNAPLASSPPTRSTRGTRSRRSSVQSGLAGRQSQYSMSSMSNAMAQLYTAHEQDFSKHRQSVTQEDLVARGLENMDFTALR